MKEKITFLEELNPVQQEAVFHTKGPLLILAGAGSGKTRVITYRIAYLIQQKKINPSNILVMTFTNKASEEMKLRVIKLLDSKNLNIWISTFHSACVRILRQNIGKLGYHRDFGIYDEKDQLVLLKECFRRLQINEEMYNPKKVLHKISNLKNNLILSEDYAIQVQDMNYFSFEQIVAKVFVLYQKLLKENNALDFDDLLMKTVQLFESHPDVLGYYHNQIKYVMVDEYQDTNHAQYQIVKLITGKNKNICVVGDDDQSIYRWRGADLRNILDFEKDYSETKVIRLEQNYRSTQKILDAAGAVISKNFHRKEKKLWTDREEGKDISYYQGTDEGDEANFISRIVKDIKLEGDKNYNDFAIFYRTNAQSRVIEDIFLKESIPYTIIGGLKFYSRKEIKDILAYLRVVVNTDDTVRLKRIINLPPRGIGQNTVNKIGEFAQKRELSFYTALKEILKTDELNLGIKNKLGNFIKMMDELKQAKDVLSIPDFIKQLLDKIGYIEYLQNRKDIQKEDRLDNLKELISAAVEFEQDSEDKSMDAFLDQKTLSSDIDNYDGYAGMVSLMTFHSAKGLEFPVVFMSGMEEGLFPHPRSMEDRHELEEERRLCYVGMTRAKERLFLTGSIQRIINGYRKSRLPSRFISDVPADIIKDVSINRRWPGEYVAKTKGIDYKQIYQSKREKNGIEEDLNNELFQLGSNVQHPKFGVGRVVSREGNGEDMKVVISFTGIGRKRLAVKYANLVSL